LFRFKGGIIAVSHDQHFIQSTCSELWVVDKTRGTGLDRFDGTFAAYKARVLREGGK
jgi:ATPase subunit of ABC transporter with duplicated ATPase domains